MALCFGMTDGQAAASALVERIIQRMAGSNFYVPSIKAHQRRKDHLAMREKFNGTNVQQLAKEYEISERQVRRIISDT